MSAETASASPTDDEAPVERRRSPLDEYAEGREPAAGVLMVLAVAAVMGVLALTAARSVIRQALAELRPVPAHA